jgi:anti-anti-sigma regulatory factor
MRSEALDITIESRFGAVWLKLSGPFHNEQVPNIKEKILGFISDGSRHIVVDLEAVSAMSDNVVPMFLALLNTMRGKHGDLKFVFRNEAVSAAFAPFRNIFLIYPDSQSMRYGRFLAGLRRQSMLLSRRTGIRISRPVALFLLFVLCGWFLTLGYILQMQNRMIREQESKIKELSTWKLATESEVTELRERIRPLRQLGLLADSVSHKR